MPCWWPKVETEQQVALATELGIDLLQGYWFAQPVVVHGQSIRPWQATILHLINLVRQQASTSEIEDVLKARPCTVVQSAAFHQLGKLWSAHRNHLRSGTLSCYRSRACSAGCTVADHLGG